MVSDAAIGSVKKGYPFNIIYMAILCPKSVFAYLKQLSLMYSFVLFTLTFIANPMKYMVCSNIWEKYI